MANSKPLHQRLAWDRKKLPVIIPDWLYTYAQSWCEAGAKSVYLFGSRSNGYYLPDSDWDIGVVLQFEEGENPVDYENICYPKGEEINEVRLTAEEIHQQIPNIKNIAREIARSKLIKGESLPLPPKPHHLNREELRQHLSIMFDMIQTTLLRINEEWLLRGKNKNLDDLFDHLTEANSADAAERLVKGLCCIYEQEFEMVHSITELIKHVPAKYESLIRKMNATTRRLPVSSYHAGPMESSQDSLNRVDCTLDLLDEIVVQGDMNLTQEEMAHIKDKHDPNKSHSYWNKHDENIHPEISTIKFRMDRTIEGLLNQVERDVNEGPQSTSKKGGRFD